MLLSNAHRSDQGFTLIELLIIVVIVGILTAIAAPSFLALLNRSRIHDALVAVEGALKEAQREAVKRSTSCTITLSTNSVTGPCLVTGSRNLKNEIQLATNISGSPATVTFSHRGTVTLSDTGTIVLYRSDSSNGQRCLVMSSPLGIVRTGNYSGSTSSVTASSCIASL